MPKLKLDNGAPVYTDGKLILISDDGSETPFDAVGVYSTFGALRTERDDAQKAAKAATEAMKAFGSTDAERASILELAKKAKAFDDKKLVDAGKIEEVVSERLKDATAAWNKEKASIESERDEARGSVRKHLIESQIRSSKALKGTIFENAPEAVIAMFGNLFDMDGEGIVSFRDGAKKDKVYSRSEPAKPADVDEALSIHLTSHPNYTKWKLGVNANGGGAPGAANASPNNNDKTSPESRLNTAFAGGVAA